MWWWILPYFTMNRTKSFAFRKHFGQSEEAVMFFFLKRCFLFSCVKFRLMNNKTTLHLPDTSEGLSRFGSFFPDVHCLVSRWLRANWTTSGWKVEMGVFLLLVLLGQRGLWRSIWPEAFPQPDHRHKLTTCALVHKPNQFPWLGDPLGFF